MEKSEQNEESIDLINQVLQTRVLQGVNKMQSETIKQKADVSTSPLNTKLTSHWTNQTGTNGSEGGISAFERGLNLMNMNRN